MQRDTVWTHELLPPAGGTGLEDAIVCAAPLHNINCPHGVVLMGRGGRLHISSVRAPPRAASATRYDVAWPMTKMGLRATGHYVCHLPLAKAIVVAISVAELLPDTAPQPKNPNAPNAKADNVAVAALEGAPRYQERYELRLLDETTWATLDTYPLGEQEWVTALQLMTLQREMPNPNAPNPATLPAHLRNLPMSAERIRKPTPLLVVGTAVVLGEDSNCTGRLLLLDIDSVLEGGAGKGGGEAGEGEGEGDADEGSMRMVRRFRVAVDHEERGPILSVAQMQGKLQVRLSHSGPLLGSS
jgi:cleavage and polyadenylation specificity factor subunit 1